MGSICNTDANTKQPIQSWESYTREQELGRPEIAEPKNDKLSSITSLEKIPENPDEVIRDLENRQYPVVKEVLQSNAPISDSTNNLMNFMINGTEEFKERTGRPMTYGEMRAAWG
jgi:hypothetical protein